MDDKPKTYAPDEIKTTDGDWFESLFAMERRILEEIGDEEALKVHYRDYEAFKRGDDDSEEGDEEE